MKGKLIPAMAAVMALAASVPALAHTPTPTLDRSERRFEMRIENGIRRGVLTRNEARILRSELRQLYRLENRYEADGYLSRRERHILTDESLDLSRHITQLCRNDNHRNYRDGWENWDGEYRDRDGRSDRDGKWDRDGRHNGDGQRDGGWNRDDRDRDRDWDDD